MSERDQFIALGSSRAAKAIEAWAKEEIQAIEGSTLGDEEKARAIEKIEAEKAEKLKNLADQHILWSRTPAP